MNKFWNFSTMKGSTSTYYPHIDGIRGLAVLSVLLYHVDFTFFSGGYVGVDVFFVISGYLITSHILNDINSGTFRISLFYARRARRLIPALLFTIIVTFGAGVFIFPASNLERLGNSVIYSILSLANIFFWNESGYFDSASTLKPLLHLWSLSVEEQFYLLWPTFLLVLKRTWITPVSIIAIGILSLVLGEYLITQDSAAVFFLTPFRIIEFSIGGILVRIKQNTVNNNCIFEILTTAGLLLLSYSVVTYTDTTIFPGISVLLPCFATALLIFAGHAKFSGRILRNSVLTWVGIVSYSLYLAHWPIVVFYKYLTHSVLSLVDQVSILAGSFVLAVFMYSYVESPFRKYSNGAYHIRGKQYAGLVILCVITIASLALHASMNDGWTWRFKNTQLTMAQIEAGKYKRFKIYQDLFPPGREDTNSVPFKNKDKNVIILGDSHAVDALNILKTAFPNYCYTQKSFSGCPPIATTDRSLLSAGHPGREKCISLNEEILSLLQQNEYSYIVINVLFDWYTPGHLLNFIDEIKKLSAAEIIVFGNYIVLNEDFPELISKNIQIENTPDKIKNFALYETELQEQSIGKYTFISKKSLFCKNDKIESCQMFFEEVPFTYDLHHLSYEACMYIADKIKTLPVFQ